MSEKKAVWVEEGEHLTIATPHGTISVFVGKHHRSINALIEDVFYTGVYTKPTKKKSRKKLKSYFGGWRRVVSLIGKEADE
jgi:hypothetical protein